MNFKFYWWEEIYFTQVYYLLPCLILYLFCLFNIVKQSPQINNIGNNMQ